MQDIGIGSPSPSASELTETRKLNHLDLAQASSLLAQDPRFNYEPLLGVHPAPGVRLPTSFWGKTLGAPLWISSMTGGTEEAFFINQNLALVAKEFGLGMGLGSCRSLLTSEKYLSHFSWRKILGPDLPLLANIGIAQVEKMALAQNFLPLEKLIKLVEANGLIVHINPLQEWLQPEGDRLSLPALTTLKMLMQNFSYPIMVKEVGQGMGPQSLSALLDLAPQGIEFAALGGSNFSWIELQRQAEKNLGFEGLAHLGHTALDMVQMMNQRVDEKKQKDPAYRAPELVISGGLQTFLDIHYLSKKLRSPNLGGFAGALLKRARVSHDELRRFVEAQVCGLALAEQFLTLRE